MSFTLPWMLLGLTALPVLAAVYWFRSRSRQAVVSNLAFWTDPQTPRQGGRILHRMQTPLTLLLELLVIAALVLAAAGPVMVRHDLVRPLVVVLDDSYSMLAKRDEKADSSRQRAAAALTDLLKNGDYLARFVLAGARPRLAGEADHDNSAVGLSEILEQWICQSPAADLSAATALAAQVGGPTARILVLADHAPAAQFEGGQVEWWAFGEPLPNLAFTAATRTESGGKERVLLEVANLSGSATKGELTLEGGNLSAARTSSLELAAGAVRQIFLDLPAGSSPLRATLAPDALDIDNHVVLLPASTRPLRVRIDLADTKLRQAVARALAATDETLEADERPDLVVSDGQHVPMVDGDFAGEVWRMEILPAKEAEAYVGPFVINRNHPLVQGLSLTNTVWSGGSQASLTGLPIITAGNVPLLTESEESAGAPGRPLAGYPLAGGGARRLQLSFAPAASNLQDTPDWPILFANVVKWRRAGLPGVRTPNVRLGGTVAFVPAQDAKEIEIVSPDKTSRKLPVRGRRVAVAADRAGLYEINTPDGKRQFTANVLFRDTSDLTACQTGRWGNWNRSPTYQDNEFALGWPFLLAAVALMTGHAALVARSSGGRAT
jgi:hypothetical protein